MSLDTSDSLREEKLITLENLERFKSNLENTYGRPGGLAQLDIDAHIPERQIPDKAYNIREYEDRESFPEEGESEKLYVDMSTNNLYRWDADNSEYVSASSPDGVKYIPQELTNAQKQQARDNIGAISAEDVPPGNNVQYVPQELTTEQKAQARQNINAVAPEEIPPGDNVQYTGTTNP